MTAQESASPSKTKRGRESKRALRARVEQITVLLRATYPDAECALLYRNAWELLVSTSSFRTVHGQAGEYGNAGAVRALSHSGSLCVGVKGRPRNCD